MGGHSDSEGMELELELAQEGEHKVIQHWIEVTELLAPRSSVHHATVMFAFEGVIDAITPEAATKLRGDLYGARVRVGLCASSHTSLHKLYDPCANYAEFVRGTWFQVFVDQATQMCGEVSRMDQQGHFYKLEGDTATCIRCTGDKGDVARRLNMPTLLIDGNSACIASVCDKGEPGSYGALVTRNGCVEPFPLDPTRMTGQRKWMKLIKEWLDLIEGCSKDAIDFFMPTGRRRPTERPALTWAHREEPGVIARRWLRESANQDCPICMTAGRLDIATTCCGTSLHHRCWTNCVQFKNACPFCRQDTIAMLYEVDPAASANARSSNPHGTTGTVTAEVGHRVNPGPIPSLRSSTPGNEDSDESGSVLYTTDLISGIPWGSSAPPRSRHRRRESSRLQQDQGPVSRRRRALEWTCDAANCRSFDRRGWFGAGEWSQYFFCRRCWRTQ